jgi:hypothetical protein
VKPSILILWAAALLFAVARQARADVFNFVGNTIQTYTAPAAGNYSIIVAGAQGGNAVNAFGGLGVVVGGTINLTASQQLKIVVGGQGATGDYGNDQSFGGGGGGGSFVYVVGAAHRRGRWWWCCCLRGVWVEGPDRPVRRLRRR